MDGLRVAIRIGRSHRDIRIWGLLRLKSREDRALESVWFYRNDEGQLSSPINGWVYEDQPTSAGNKHFVRDLPEGGGRYFAFPLYLMSDKSQTALSLTR